MFSLKFDLLFPSLESARQMAKSLNGLLKGPAPPTDPREHKRMLDELRLARYKAQAQAVARRLFLD